MVDIYRYTESALSQSGNGYFTTQIEGKNISIPIYNGMPDFGDNEPDFYITYSTTDQPDLFADDEENAQTFSITINIFSPLFYSCLLNDVKQAMKKAGFVYQGGNEIGSEAKFPSHKRYYQEFQITF